MMCILRLEKKDMYLWFLWSIPVVEAVLLWTAHFQCSNDHNSGWVWNVKLNTMEFYLLLQGTASTCQGTASSHRLAFSWKETVHPKSRREPCGIFSPKTLPPPLFMNSYFFWSPAMSETPDMMSQHEDRATSFMLEALQAINMLHRNAPTTIWISDKQFAITCKQAWADPAALLQFP